MCFMGSLIWNAIDYSSKYGMNYLFMCDYVYLEGSQKSCYKLKLVCMEELCVCVCVYKCGRGT